MSASPKTADVRGRERSINTDELWTASVVAVLVLGVAPGVLLAARGGPVRRLVGLQLTSVSTVLVLVGLCVVFDEPSYLIVPLALSLLSTAGTLVFTRLLREHGVARADAATGGPADD
jgi:Multiple resistance and pH regulation protein F (MrpF / PhaF).